MSDNDSKNGPPAKLKAKPLQAQVVKATPLDPGQTEIATRAGLVDMLATGTAVKVAKNVADVRHLQSRAADSIARTTRSIRIAQRHLIGMQEDLEEAEIRKIERQRRRKKALNDSFMDDQNMNILNAAAAVRASQVLKGAEAASVFQDLSNQQQLQEKRIELLRLTKQEEQLKRELYAAGQPPAPPPGPDPVEAKVRYIVKDAAEDLVRTGPEYLYHAYAGCHYLAARLRGVSHDAAVADTYDLVLARVRMHPLPLADAMEYQKRYESLKGAMRSRVAADRSAAAEQQRTQAQLNVEQLRKEMEEYRLRTAQQMATAFGYMDDEVQA